MFSFAKVFPAGSFRDARLLPKVATAQGISGVRNCAGNLRHQNSGSQRASPARPEPFKQATMILKVARKGRASLTKSQPQTATGVYRHFFSSGQTFSKEPNFAPRQM